MRRGVQVLEMVLITPVFVAVFVAAVQYVPVLIGQSTLTHAAGEGAREAGKGGNLNDVVAAVNKVLLANNLAVTDAPGLGDPRGAPGRPEHFRVWRSRI